MRNGNTTAGVPPPGTKRPRGGIYKVPEPDDKPDCPLQVKMEAEPQDQAPAPKDPPLSFDYFTPPGDQTGELGFVAFAAMQVSHGGPDDMPSCKEFVAFDADHNGEVSRDE